MAPVQDLLGRTGDYPETLNRAIESIRSSLPEPEPGLPLVTRMQDTLVKQDTVATSMAGLLESLASHYEQMDTALKDTEAGEIFSEEDLQRVLFLFTMSTKSLIPFQKCTET